MIPSQEEALYREMGARVRALREAIGLTQEVVARRIGLTRTSVTNIERGQQKIQIHTLYALAEVLNADPESLLPRRSQPIGADIESRLRSQLPSDADERAWVRRVVER